MGFSILLITCWALLIIPRAQDVLSLLLVYMDGQSSHLADFMPKLGTALKKALRETQRFFKESNERSQTKLNIHQNWPGLKRKNNP